MGNIFFPVHPVLREISSIFTGKGKQVFLVGGAVRDTLRGIKPQDWDLATDAYPDEVISIFKETVPRGFVVPTGIKHGTVTVHYRGRQMEVTTFRTESNYSDGRRPDKVEFGVSIEDDLSRRDFTMNAIAYRLPKGPITDPFGGKADIESEIIRSVGRAEERFAEDGLRPLRAVRFASQLGFRLDEMVLAAIPGALQLCSKVAPERIREELDKLTASLKPSTGFLLMEKTGLLRLLLPELADCRGIEQKGFHRFDVLDHSLLALDYAAKTETAEPEKPAGKEDAGLDPQEKLIRRLAALYHDIGKPLVRKQDESGGWTFYRHEKESSEIARRIFLRFKYPNNTMDKVCHLIEEHMFHYEDNWTDAAVRRFIIRAGEKNLADLYALRRADGYAQAGIEPSPDSLLPLMEMMERVDKILAEKNALSLGDLAVNGNDLMEAGISRGKQMGIILRELLETVLDDPKLNTKEKLLDIAKKFVQEKLSKPAS